MRQYLIKNLFLMSNISRKPLSLKGFFTIISKLINKLSKIKPIKSFKKKGLTTVKPGDGELYF